MTIEDQVVTSDGRTLQVLEHGVPDGRPVLVRRRHSEFAFFHGPDVGLAERQGIPLRGRWASKRFPFSTPWTRSRLLW